MTAGQIIKARLDQIGMKQTELAFRAMISPQFVQDILKDKRNPSPKVAKTILLSLGLSSAQECDCVTYWIGQILGEWKELQERCTTEVNGG